MEETLKIPKKVFIVPYRNRVQHKFFFSKYMQFILEGETDTINVLTDTWFTQLLVENKSGIWERISGTPGGKGKMLFTESGTFYAIQNNTPMLVRDFTEVGHKQIHRTYPYVSTRINSLRSGL